MSKIGIAARIAAIVAAAEQTNPLAARVYRLPPALRIRYENWRTECERAMAKHGDPAAAYAAYRIGEDDTPEPPRAVADVLQFKRPPVLTEAMSVAECARIYDEFREG